MLYPVLQKSHPHLSDLPRPPKRAMCHCYHSSSHQMCFQDILTSYQYSLPKFTSKHFPSNLSPIHPSQITWELLIKDHQLSIDGKWVTIPTTNLSNLFHSHFPPTSSVGRKTILPLSSSHFQSHPVDPSQSFNENQEKERYLGGKNEIPKNIIAPSSQIERKQEEFQLKGTNIETEIRTEVRKKSGGNSRIETDHDLESEILIKDSSNSREQVKSGNTKFRTSIMSPEHFGSSKANSGVNLALKIHESYSDAIRTTKDGQKLASQQESIDDENNPMIPHEQNQPIIRNSRKIRGEMKNAQMEDDGINEENQVQKINKVCGQIKEACEPRSREWESQGNKWKEFQAKIRYLEERLEEERREGKRSLEKQEECQRLKDEVEKKELKIAELARNLEELSFQLEGMKTLERRINMKEETIRKNSMMITNLQSENSGLKIRIETIMTDFQERLFTEQCRKKKLTMLMESTQVLSDRMNEIIHERSFVDPEQKSFLLHLLNKTHSHYHQMIEEYQSQLNVTGSECAQWKSTLEKLLQQKQSQISLLRHFELDLEAIHAKYLRCLETQQRISANPLCSDCVQWVAHWGQLNTLYQQIRTIFLKIILTHSP